ncbi:CDKN2AIP N-terminal-like protein isoform X2 [Rhincodon typus]|uniref:CDKN2AIP N-terminal-like protein isoform X2 n=1 Tax=Rhincodon typus TaxID=259920 RepID=UPI0020309955|nr:CDKN2AIP N-terminal-like protein isoform X2 [Rhincodon typus]
MEESALDDFLKRNREMADCSLERLRGLSESDKHWTARRSFLVRNLSDYPRDRLDYLVALSMVWANHVFMGCRESKETTPGQRSFDGTAVYTVTFPGVAEKTY